MASGKQFRLTKLRVDEKIATPEGYPTKAFVRFVNDVIHDIEAAFNELSSSVTTIEGILGIAEGAQATVNSEVARNAIAQSYTEPGLILTAAVSTTDPTKATITVANHNRHYANGTVVAVVGGTIDLVAQNTGFYVHYDQPTRVGGAGIAYVATTDYQTAAQTGVAPNASRHACGFVTTPASSGSPPTYGGGPRPSGTGDYKGFEQIP